MINGIFNNTPVRQIKGKVELYTGSTLLNTFSYTDRLISFEVERVGEEKFFGFGVCQKANIKLIDKERQLNITTDNWFNLYIGNEELINVFPYFYVTEVHRDENTNELSITAYDYLYKYANDIGVIELGIEPPYTIAEIAADCGEVIGYGLRFVNIPEDDSSLQLMYENGANFEGTETIREVLNAIAEATQSIYYVDNNNGLVFKRLDVNGDAVLTITKDDYIELDSKTNRRLTEIVSATELGDNISVSLAQAGTTQYVRDNPFWALREDIDTILENALAAIGGLTINQFECEWRGNYLLEIGDKIALVTKDNSAVVSYLMNDVFFFDGSFLQRSAWGYTDADETASNPATIGDAIKQTFARVDKVNKQIEIVASETADNKENISQIKLDTNSITASVERMQETVKSTTDTLSNEITTLNSKVDATITAEDVNIAIQNELANGANKVVTTTGFVFDDEGLTISKSDSEMQTQITDDGMLVTKDNTEVLAANNEGVTAIDLHATTYLIIGANSRFEDYNDNRTGCFWIGR